MNNEWASRIVRLQEGLRKEALGEVEDYEIRELVHVC